MVKNTKEMKVICACVKGASHKHSGMPCQDQIKINRVFKSDITVLAASDGHGSKYSPYSDEGAKIAVDVFHSVMVRYYKAFKNNMDRYRAFLQKEGSSLIADEIEKEWKKRVRKAHRINNRQPVLSSLWQQYGATLLGLVITSSFYFAFQVGDGDIVLLTDGNSCHIINPEKMLGVETYSLSHENVREKAIAVVEQRPCVHTPHAFMISTDGFANSYPSEEAFLQACCEYYAAINEYGANTVWGLLNSWLDETSESGSGDDISVLIACNDGL